jgi:phosphosulfolactate phosphohydrolase-like enzyme
LGYFKPLTTETYTFYTASDDASYMWIGADAQSGFTTVNATVNNGGAHGVMEKFGSIALTAGTYYPIRIQFGEAGGGDVLTFNYSTPTITKTTTVTGLVFYNTTTNNF